jgi:hypothetical protein
LTRADKDEKQEQGKKVSIRKLILSALLAAPDHKVLYEDLRTGLGKRKQDVTDELIEMKEGGTVTIDGTPRSKTDPQVVQLSANRTDLHQFLNKFSAGGVQ